MSLLGISKLPTAENSAIQLHPRDNVAIARVPLSMGTALNVGGQTLKTRVAIPAGHKVAIRTVAPNETLIRYGQIIGRASRAIEPGDHVHTQNVAFEELAFNYEFPTGDIQIPSAALDAPTFQGYLREDGRAGTRNYIAVVAASNCAAHTAELIASSFDATSLPEGVDGVVAFPHGDGCGQSPGPDLAQLRRTLGGVLDHPNVSAAVILGLGCEVNQIDHYLGAGTPRTDRLAGLTLQSSGGTRGAIEASRRQI